MLVEVEAARTRSANSEKVKHAGRLRPDDPIELLLTRRRRGRLQRGLHVDDRLESERYGWPFGVLCECSRDALAQRPVQISE